MLFDREEPRILHPTSRRARYQVTAVENDFRRTASTKARDRSTTSWLRSHAAPRPRSSPSSGWASKSRRSRLEVGVGTGINTSLYPRDVPRHGHRSLLVDAREGAASASRAKGSRTRPAAAGDGRRASHLRRRRFDIVYAPYLISVVPDPVQVAREMRRVCQPGGQIIILNHFRSAEPDPLAGSSALISPFTVHIGFKSDLDLPAFLAQADLQPVSIEKVNVPRIWSLVICPEGVPQFTVRFAVHNDAHRNRMVRSASCTRRLFCCPRRPLRARISSSQTPASSWATVPVIESGTLVVRDGRIASVGLSRAPSPGDRDRHAPGSTGRGLTIMPGFIDGHRHIITGNADQWLEGAGRAADAGSSSRRAATLLAGGGPAEGNVELETPHRFGPAQGATRHSRGADQFEHRHAGAGARSFVVLRRSGSDSSGRRTSTGSRRRRRSLENLRRSCDESRKVGALVMVHAVSPQAMLAAVGCEARHCWCTRRTSAGSPTKTRKQGRGGRRQTALDHRVRRAGVRRLQPRQRRRRSATAEMAGRHPSTATGVDRRLATSGCQRPHARGTTVCVCGYGTDTGYLPVKGSRAGLKTLQPDVLDAGHREADGSQQRGLRPDEPATSAPSKPGKLADIVVASGPTRSDGYWNHAERHRGASKAGSRRATQRADERARRQPV